ADIMRRIFGNPVAVTAQTHTSFATSKNDAFAGLYQYPDMVVCAESDWSWTGFPFTADFVVNFEQATLMLKGGVLSLAANDTPMHTVDLSQVPGIPTDDPYYLETRYLAECIRDGVKNTYNPPFESRETIRLLHAIEESGDSRKTVAF
ncbi:MAG: hypothetical protein IJ302_09010, partial [Clostridia bacterium]|nr:hypothetical protein [Clostridia bacterium]